MTRDGLPLLVHLDNQRGYCNVLSCARRAAGRDIDYRRDAPFSGEPDSRATLQADRDRPALREALQDLVASEPNRLVRRVTKNPLGTAVPEQDRQAHPVKPRQPTSYPVNLEPLYSRAPTSSVVDTCQLL